jgi:hypothetical protein
MRSLSYACFATFLWYDEKNPDRINNILIYRFFMHENELMNSWSWSICCFVMRFFDVLARNHVVKNDLGHYRLAFVLIFIFFKDSLPFQKIFAFYYVCFF